MTWVWLAIIVPIAWLFENVMHEASHLICAAFKGCKPLGLYPLAHWAHVGANGEVEYRWWRPWELWKKPWPDARWYFARCQYLAPVRAWPPHTIIHISPFVWGMSLATGAGLASAFFSIYFLPLAAVGLIDALLWVRGYFWGSASCDGKRWKNGDQDG